MGSLPKSSYPQGLDQAPGWLKAVPPSYWLPIVYRGGRLLGPTDTVHFLKDFIYF